MSNANSQSVIAVNASQVSLSSSVCYWAGSFIVASASLFLLQPSAIVTASMAALLLFTMAFHVHLSLSAADEKSPFDIDQRALSILAPVQFALFMWLSVTLGNQMVGASMLTTTLAAFAAFALIIVVDAIVSTVFLLITERKHGVSGVSIAALISGKYAGLLGKIA